MTALDRTRLRARLRLASRPPGRRPRPSALEPGHDPRSDRDRAHHHAQPAGDGDQRPERGGAGRATLPGSGDRHREQGTATGDRRGAEHGEPAGHRRERPPAGERLEGRHTSRRPGRQPRRPRGHERADRHDGQQVGDVHHRAADRPLGDILDDPVGHERWSPRRSSSAPEIDPTAPASAPCADEEPLHGHRCGPRRGEQPDRAELAAGTDRERSGDDGARARSDRRRRRRRPRRCPSFRSPLVAAPARRSANRRRGWTRRPAPRPADRGCRSRRSCCSRPGSGPPMKAASLRRCSGARSRRPGPVAPAPISRKRSPMPTSRASADLGRDDHLRRRWPVAGHAGRRSARRSWGRRAARRTGRE